MKIFFCWLAFVCGLYVLQASFFPLVAYNGVSPDLVILLVVSFSFLKGQRMGVFMGFMVGLLQDLASGTFFGTNIFSKMLIGYLGGVFANRVFREQVFLPLFASVMATALNYAVMVMFMFLLGHSLNLIVHLQQTLLPMIWYNMLFSVPVHRCVALLCDRLLEKK